MRNLYVVPDTPLASTIRLLLVDDNPLFRGHLERWLNRRTTINVIGLADSGREAVLLSTQLCPDVVLMDTGMAPMSGFEAAKQIRHAQIPSRIVLMATNRREEYAEEFNFYCDGFLQKDQLLTELIPLLTGLFPCSMVASKT